MQATDTDGVIEFIAEGGNGSEARIIIELRTRFPGIGGNIITNEGAVTALREEYSPIPKTGHFMFLRHLIVKKIEDYFFRTRVYKYSHIPRPFGSISGRDDKPYEAYLYEWVFGDEGFPWQVMDNDGHLAQLSLHDWNEFVGIFNSVGIDLLLDITDPDDGRISKNIIYQFNRFPGKMEMSSIWKRIDFGFRSITINYEKLSKFFTDSRKELINVLRIERYEMMTLALEYLVKRGKMSGIHIGKLEVMVGDYRRATLSHFISRGSGLSNSAAFFGDTTDSLI
ncbi:MAG: hypothetical protein WCU00_09270 [Candidatus Latescibacterota bacterium]